MIRRKETFGGGETNCESRAGFSASLCAAATAKRGACTGSIKLEIRGVALTVTRATWIEAGFKCRPESGSPAGFPKEIFQ
jgi:hypothetical protein